MYVLAFSSYVILVGAPTAVLLCSHACLMQQHPFSANSRRAYTAQCYCSLLDVIRRPTLRRCRRTLDSQSSCEWPRRCTVASWPVHEEFQRRFGPSMQDRSRRGRGVQQSFINSEPCSGCASERASLMEVQFKLVDPGFAFLLLMQTRLVERVVVPSPQAVTMRLYSISELQNALILAKSYETLASDSIF